MNQQEREQKVFNLTVELEDTNRMKRSAVKSFNEDIKRIKKEIKDLLAPATTAANVL